MKKIKNRKYLFLMLALTFFMGGEYIVQAKETLGTNQMSENQVSRQEQQKAKKEREENKEKKNKEASLKLNEKEKQLNKERATQFYASDFFTVEKGDYVASLYDSWDNLQEVYLTDIYEAGDDTFDFVLDIYSENPYAKDDNYRIELYTDKNDGSGIVEFAGAAEATSYGYTHMTFTTNINMYSVLDQEYLYIRFGTLDYYSTVFTSQTFFKVKNPFYTGSWERYDSGWYFKLADGSYATGWQYIDYSYYYFNNGGIMQSNTWVHSGDTWYYVDTDGTMIADRWIYLDGYYYYFDYNGAMLTGWQFIDGKWYYLQGGGEMSYGWAYINDGYYYFGNSGEMQTGWIYADGWYYCDASGKMLTGWNYIDNGWYYLQSSGLMSTGWNFIDGNWYYMYDGGVMATNTTLDGWYIGYDGIAHII